MEVKFKHFLYPIIIHPTQIKELHEITESNDALTIGASITLNELQDALKHYIKIKPGELLFLNIKKKRKIYIFFHIFNIIILLDFQTRIFTEIVKMLHFFGGKQIRNVAVSFYNFFY